MVTEQAFQFIRLEPYNRHRAVDILLEADRAPSHSSHVARPRAPYWKLGSADVVQAAIDAYLQDKQEVRHQNGATYLRSPRSDHRVLLGCVSSYPIDCETLARSSKAEQALATAWLSDVDGFMAEEFSGSCVAAVLHTDETYPHLHHYAVGHAARLHPGLRAEMENGRRIADAQERRKRYRQAMRDFLDRFHERVGYKYGHARSGGIRPSPRIRDRKTYFAIKKIEALLRENGVMDPGQRAQEFMAQRESK